MSDDASDPYRDLQMNRVRTGLKVQVVEYFGDHPDEIESQTAGRYCFADASAMVRRAGQVRGDWSHIPVPLHQCGIYTGESIPVHGDVQPHALEDVPFDVLKEVTGRDWHLLADVKGGWANWDGRPTHSPAYVDLGDATLVDTDAYLAERCDDWGLTE